MSRCFTPALLALLATAQPSGAQPLTCDTFRTRVDGGLLAGGDKPAEVPTYKQRPSGSDTTRFGWSTSDLSGTLTCGGDGAFREFYTTLDVTSRDRVAPQLKQLVALDGAAICAFSDASLPACLDYGKILLQEALEVMGAGYRRRTPNASGLSRRVLRPDVTVELTAAPSMMTFSISAVGVVDEARLPLSPPR